MDRLLCLLMALVTISPPPGKAHADLEPDFSEVIPNITASVGDDVTLNCKVENLGSYRVAWLRLESKTILTIHRNVISLNYRLSLKHNDHQSWNLQISNVQESDRGGYMCQINTVPMKSIVGYLEVLVPPAFVDAETSTDMLVRETTNVSLSCRVSGYPPPTVTWRREDGQSVVSGNCQGVPYEETYFEGEELSIVKISRLHMGAYLCIAENGVPPSITRKIMLQVNFPPMIWVPHMLVGAPLNGEVHLECNTEAYPMSINYWTKGEVGMIVNNNKFVSTSADNTYKVQMKLTIKNIQQEDYGNYWCHSKNSLGVTHGTIKLYPTEDLTGKESSTPDVHKDAENARTSETTLLRESLERRRDEKFPMLDDSQSKGQQTGGKALPKRPRKTEGLRNFSMVTHPSRNWSLCSIFCIAYWHLL